MKPFLKQFLLPFLAYAFVIGLFLNPMSKQTGVNPIVLFAIITLAVLVVVAFTKRPVDNFVKNGVEVEVWANYIIQRLFKDNAFLQRVWNDDDKVLAGKIVHIPQPGAKPVVVKNRTSYPATAVTRADTDVTYVLDTYTTAPTHIQEAEKVELSYDKIDSVYGDHAGQISEDVAGSLIVTWATGIPATNIIRTTSATTTTDLLPGLTGTRKVHVHQDLRKMQTMFNKWNVPKEGRVAMYTPDMLAQLLESLSTTQYRDFSAAVNPQEGIIGRLYGFDIIERSEVCVATDTAGVITINPYGTANAAANCDVILCWQKDAIARALGDVKFFDNPNRAEFHGDIYSALLRAGGRRRRADDIGVGAIVQAS